MRRLVEMIQRLRPRQQSRRWRYVSGRRRRRGIVCMTLLIIGLAGWYGLTNDGRVREMANDYLSRRVQANVRIQEASFEIFEGIKLTGVRIFKDEGGRISDILQAREVYLRFSLWQLLGGDLSAAEIICVEPILTITEDVDNKRWNYQSLFRKRGKGGSLGELPIIRIRDGEFRRNEIYHGVVIPLCAERFSASALPAGREGEYKLEIATDASADRALGEARLSLDPISWEWTGGVPATLLRRTLPHKYRAWFDAYQVSGVFHFKGQSRPASGQAEMTFALTDVSMAAPASQGGFQLTSLNGIIEFCPSGVRIKRVVGRMPQLGDAPVVVDGRFDGFDADAPMEFRCDIQRVTFPLPACDSSLGEILAEVQQDFSPAGDMRVEIRGGRRDDGELFFVGKALPQSMTAQAKYFPLPVRDLRGEIEFNQDRVTLHSLTGRHGEAAVELNGWVSPHNPWPFDVTIEVEDAPAGTMLSEVMGNSSVPEIRTGVRRNYDVFSPAGSADVRIRVFTPDAPHCQAEVDLALDGKIDGAWKHFPYPLSGISGKVSIRPDSVRIDGVRGRNGDGWVELNGTVTDLYATVPTVELHVDAVDVALDDQIGTALAAQSPDDRAAYDSLGLGGRADIVGTVNCRDDAKFSYDLRTTLKDASLTYEKFPYPLTDVTGVTRLTSERIEIERLVGRGGRADVSLVGWIELAGKQARPDLVINAINLEFDEKLAQAVRVGLPESVAAWWDKLKPAGTADVRFELTDEPAAAGKDPIRLTARDMSVTWDGFPYPIRGLRGEVLCRPGRVRLNELSSDEDGTSLRLDGVLNLAADDLDSADLRLQAKGVLIDEAFLAAAGKAHGPVAKWFTPGGSFDMDMPVLRYKRSPAGAAVASTQPADADRPWPWEIQGDLTLHQAAMDIGVKTTDLTGSIGGTVSIDDRTKAFAVDAAIMVEAVSLWGRPATQVKGFLRKPRGETTLRLTDLVAKYCGGRMAGNVDVDLADGGACSMKLDVLNLKLNELLKTPENADAHPDKRGGEAGKLNGWFSFQTAPEGSPRRQGRGEVLISDAKIAKIPFMLGLMNAMMLQLPTQASFSRGTAKYLIEDDVLMFRRIQLEGDGRSVMGFGKSPTSIVGGGTVNLSDEEMNLVLCSGPPNLLKGPFAELWSLTASGLSTTHVTGSWRKPEVKPVQFKKIRGLLEEALGRSR